MLTGERKVRRDAFGRAMAMGGATLAVGEHMGAYVFTRIGNSTTLWARTRLLWPPTRVRPVKKDGFGAVVAVGGGGSYAVVGGAFFATSFADPPTKIGAAYVYDSANWTAPPAVLPAGSKAKGASGFGAAVAAAARAGVVAVGEGPTGCSQNPKCPPSRGTVRVFRRRGSGSGKWRLTATLAPPNPAWQTNFGNRVALSPDGRYLAAAAKGLPDRGSNGSVYVYSYDSGMAGWVLRSTLTCPDPRCLGLSYSTPKVNVSDRFPSKVVVFTDDTLLVSHGGDSSTGFIFTYRLNAAEEWVLNQTIEGQELIGSGLAAAGKFLVEGEYYIEERIPGTTQVVEYRRNGWSGGWGQWVRRRRIEQPRGAPAYFGQAVAIDAATGAVIVGARNGDGSDQYVGVGPGVVYVFPPRAASSSNVSALPVPEVPTSGAPRRRLLSMR